MSEQERKELSEEQVPVEQPAEISAEDLDNVAGGLTKVGAGTLALGGDNTYVGATTVDQGVLPPFDQKR